MLKIKRTVALLLLLIGIFCSLSCSSQNILLVTDSTGLGADRIERGDTFTLVYDTAFILNKRLYRLYKNIYDKASNGNLMWQEYARAYTDVIKIQDSALKSKDLYYSQLKQGFDSLAGRTNTFLSKTDKGLTDINQRLSNATGNLENIKTSITSALESLKLQKRQKVHLILGGVAIGVSIASIIFLAAK